MSLTIREREREWQYSVWLGGSTLTLHCPITNSLVGLSLNVIQKDQAASEFF